MRPLVLFILLFAWVNACAPVSHKKRKRHRKAYPIEQSIKKLKLPKPVSRQAKVVLRSSLKTSLLPTLLNRQDQSLMILIDTGKYLVRKKKNSTHRNLDDEKSPLVNLNSFYINRTEVTVAQFIKYQPSYDEKIFTSGKDCPKCPAMGINWIQASKYCRWAGMRLPQEEEWEAAARGVSNFSYPWGEFFHAQNANLHGKEDGYLFAAPVGSFHSGVSINGLVDMAGNVWEWVDNKSSTRQRLDTRIVKGGGWTSNKDQALISFRNHVNLKMNNPTFGFRCAKSLVQKRIKQSP